LASFDVIILILRLICAFRENLRVLMKKIAFRRIQERNRGQMDLRKSPQKRMERGTIVHGRRTTVPQAQKGGTAVLLTVDGARLPVRGTHGRAPLQGCAPHRFFRYNAGFRCVLGGSFGWGFKSCSIRVSLSHSQTPMGANKVG